MWTFGIASGLVAIVIFGVRRSNRGRKLGTVSKARLVSYPSGPCATEPNQDEPTETAAMPFAATNRVESVGSLDDRPRLAVPATALGAMATIPINTPRTIKATQSAVTAFLIVLLITGYGAVLAHRMNRLINQHELEQHAWISVAVPKVYPLTEDGGGFAIELRNLGKTPALQVSVTDYVVIEELDRLTDAQEASSHPSTVVGTLAPGSGVVTDIWFKTSAEGVTGLSQGKVRAVNYAVVTYEDMLHRTHTTRSCFYWHGGLAAPLACDPPFATVPTE